MGDIHADITTAIDHDPCTVCGMPMFDGEARWLRASSDGRHAAWHDECELTLDMWADLE